MKKRYFYMSLVVISLVGLVLRLVGGGELLKNYPPVAAPAPTTDMYTYQTIARAIVSGDYNWDSGFYYQPFYYTVFLPVVYKLSNGSPWGVIICQSILGTVIIGLVGLIFSGIYGKRAGLIAALMTALNRYLIFYTPFSLIAVLQAFWISLIGYCCYVAYRTKNPWFWVVTGVITGIAITTRGNILILIPAILYLIVVSYRKSRRYAWGLFLLFLICSFLPQLPYSIINYRALDRWVGSSSAGAAVLALGNTPESPPGGRDFLAGPGPMEYPETSEEWTRNASLKNDRRTPISEPILDWIRREPLAFIELKFRMFLLFWNKGEIPNNVAISSLGKPLSSRILNLPFLIDFIVIGSFGLAGMIISIRQHRKKPIIIFMVGMTILYMLATIAFYILARFRLPIVPFLCGFSGYTISVLIRYWRLSRVTGHYRGKLLGVSILCCLTGVFVAYGFDIYRHTLEHSIMRVARPSGVQVELDGKSISKDHGPRTFGGWIPVPMNSFQSIRKDFAIRQPPDFQNTVMIRFPVLCSNPATFSYTLTTEFGQERSDPTAVQCEPGLQWIEKTYKFDPGQPFPRDILELHLRFATDSSDLSLVFDTQRDYGRTRIDQHSKNPYGEMVAELVLKH